MTRISVVICCKDRPAETGACLNSIAKQSRKPDEVVIVDSSQSTQLGELLSQFSTQTGIPTKYLHDSEAGLARARNLGVCKSRGDIVSFIDDDVVLLENYIAEIVKVFDGDSSSKVGAVTGERVMWDDSVKNRLLTSGPLLLAYDIFARVFLLLHYGDGRFLPSGHPTIIKPGTIDGNVRVEYLVGANMSFRRTVLEEFEFDEALPYFDDNDIAFRVSRKYHIICATRAKYIHHMSTGGQGRGMYRCRRDVFYYLRFFNKNYPATLRTKLISHWSILGFYLRAAVARVMRPILRNRITAY